ncbi:uncharacterized protein G2W53_035194 [Senna tora]|uniref:Uncharacterized protein n=1 Tax=Senna tora TaxID=362788 RepID=A0A834SRW0_9FABA|nr:uncharacterized protein G2W53_035194 [Senna tora]
MRDSRFPGLVFQLHHRPRLLPAGLRGCLCSSGYPFSYHINGSRDVSVIGLS